MSASDPRIERYLSLRPSGLRILEALSITRQVSSERATDFVLTLRLKFIGSGESGRVLYLEFTGVRDLKVGNLEGLLGLAIEISPVRDQQLEGIRYRVSEEEHGTLSFWCGSFDASLIESEA